MDGAKLVLRVVFANLMVLILVPSVEARDRLFCVAPPWYSGYSITCGGHLQPVCTSGAACNAGHNLYNSPPHFPRTIDCPTIRDPVFGFVIYDVPDETVTGGCYNRIPTCDDCGAGGQPPCPPEAEPVCGGCDDGHQENAITGLCEIPGTPGQACGFGTGCGPGLNCDPFSLQCVAESGIGDYCDNVFYSCADGLQCTLALQCSSAPFAQRGETCDATAPCADGLFCQPGIPQRCIALKKPGETCNPFEPCVDGAFCVFDPTGGFSQCFPDGGPITPQRCESFYSASVDANSWDDATRTISSGNGASAGVSESTAYGVAYGQDDRFGCYTSLCSGYDADISIEAFIANGRYDDYGMVGGSSFATVGEAQLPGSLFNVSVALVYGDEGLANLIGTETAISIGLGLSPIPATVGIFECETDLTTIYGDIIQPPAPGPTDALPGPPPAAPLAAGALQFDGVDDVLRITDPLQLQLLQVTDALTLEAWIRPLASNQTATLVSKDGEYLIGLQAGKLAYQLANDSPGWSTLRTSSAEPRLYDWTHVALVYDGSATRLYVDGEVAVLDPGSGSIGDHLPDDDLFTVAAGPGGASPFTGQVDSLRVWSRALARLEILAGANEKRLAGEPGLLAAWHFDETSGNGLVDASGSGLNFSLADAGAMAAPTRRADGRNVVGGSLSLDGADDHAAVLGNDIDLAGLVLTDVLTIEAWIYPRGPGADATFGGMIVSKEGEYSLGRMPDGRINFALDNLSPNWVTVVTDVMTPENRWSHVALTYDAAAGEIRLHLDGLLVDTRPGSGPISDHHPEAPQLRIGGRQRNETDGVQQKFHGLIDELRIWNVARSEIDIAADYDQVIDPAVAGLLAYWRFDEGPVALAFDSTSATRHAALGSGRAWQSPARSDTSGTLGYPRSLLAPTCSAGVCALDADGDGVSNYTDNCQLKANPGQVDTDVDGYGNYCDPDFDNSGTVNFADLGYMRSQFFSNDAEADLDSSGVVNFADVLILRQHFFGAPGPSARVP